MSVKSVTADHADPSHNHVRADPVATLSLGNTPVDADGRMTRKGRYRYVGAIPTRKKIHQCTCGTTVHLHRYQRT